MLYLDYDEGPWMPNKDGGNRNLEGYGFLQKLNREIKKRYPDVMMVAKNQLQQRQSPNRLKKVV